MESISPNLYVTNLPETIAFYQLLGFQVIQTVPDEGALIFAMMQCGKVTFLFQTIDSVGEDLPQLPRTIGGSLLLYLQINGIRDFYQKIQAHVTVIKPLETTFYGATEFSITDNNGYILTFAEDE